MTTPPSNSPSPSSHGAPPTRDALLPNDESPGVPGFHTWRGVYLFVFGVFIVIVIALTLFSRAYA